MKKHVKTLLLAIGLLCNVFCVTYVRAADDYYVVAYVTSWSQGLPDPSRMTHINYAFGHVGKDFRSVTIDNTSRLQQIVALKKRNPELKVLLSIGGWGSGGFSEMARDEKLRLAFCTSVRQACDRYDLDGIDIDWEFPGSTAGGLIGASSADKGNYTLLMRDLRTALGKDLLLTMASNYETSAYNFRDFIQYMDFVNVMCYNMASPPNHHAALYKANGPVSKGYYSCQMAMNAHLSAGVPTTKLVMGMPLYGHELNRGEQSYQRVKDLLATGNYTEDWDDRGKVPWLKKSDGTFYMDFDNERSIEYKCRYIMAQHFKGGMYWDYHSDDRQGTLRNTVYRLLLKQDTGNKKVLLDGEEMTCTAYQRYQTDADMKQGQCYSIMTQGHDVQLEADWDFFCQQEDGTLRFLAIDGHYRILADLDLNYISVETIDTKGEPAKLATNGSGAVWVIGNEGIGKPSYQAAGHSWSADEGAMCMSPVEERTHQLTLQVGKHLDANNVGFKFFHQKGWGGEFHGSGENRITSVSVLFGIGNGTNGHDNGNVFLKPGAALEEGAIYRFTLRFTFGISSVTLRVEDVSTGLPILVDEQKADLPWYRLDGTAIPTPTPTGRGIFVRGGRKVLK